MKLKNKKIQSVLNFENYKKKIIYTYPTFDAKIIMQGNKYTGIEFINCLEHFNF